MTDQLVSEEKSPVSKHTFFRNIGILFSAFAVIILIGAFSFAYYQLIRVNVSLSDTMAAMQVKATNQEQQLGDMQKSIETLQQFAQKSDALATQQEQMLTEWRAAQKGDLNKWRIAEAEYLIKLANDHWQFVHDKETTLMLLMRAKQVLDNLQDPNLVTLITSLTTDINALQNVADINITQLYLQLTKLDAELDALPFPKTLLTAEEKAMPSIPENTPWWKASWERSVQALSKIVIVRNNAQALPLLLPEQKSFLMQNLHAKMQNTMWAVLNRNNVVYQESLLQAKAWIKHYFEQEDDKTKAVLQEIDALRKMNIEPATINFANTLQLFNNLMRG